MAINLTKNKLALIYQIKNLVFFSIKAKGELQKSTKMIAEKKLTQKYQIRNVKEKTLQEKKERAKLMLIQAEASN